MNSHFQKLISNKIFKDPAAGLSLPFSTIELTRDFIKDSLYNQDYGYFSKKNIILPVKEPIPFRKLLNRSSYLGEQRKRYDNAVTNYRWHTPSEIFNPTYAKIIFEWILSHHHRNHHRKDDYAPLVIYEIGGGNGTLKNGIIERSKELQIPIGEYNIIDISTHSPSVIKRDFLDSSIFTRETRNCFVLGMEVLDNLPQDKIRWHNGALEESYVITGVNGGSFLEIFLPSEDPLIKECVLAIIDDPKHVWKSLQRTKFKDFLLAYLPDSIKSVIDEHPFSIGSSQLRETFPHHSEFIPTGPFKFLKNLKQQFPFSYILLSDFHYLPRHNNNNDDNSGNGCGGVIGSIANSSSINGPLVQGWMDGEQVECSSHLLKKGEFDIFFPINFDLLSHFWSQINSEERRKEKKTKIWSHREFIEKFGNGIEQECQTRSGYNPLKEEFSNASFIALNGDPQQ